MKDVGDKKLTNYPRPADFANAIMDNTGVSTGQVIIGAAVDAANAVISYASIFSNVVIIGGIIFVGVFLYNKSGAKLPKWKF